MGLFSWLGGLVDPGHDVNELARRLGMDAAALWALQPEYVAFSIAKRSGGRRQILAPKDDLKALQRRVLDRLLARLHVHPAAIGFEAGRSIVDHAALHRDRAVVVRLDIVDFFGTTPAWRINRYFRTIGWNRRASGLLTRLTTRDGRLPQGAPTSPKLSNLVNYRLDARLASLTAKVGGPAATYSRYADDLTFSLAEHDEERVHRLIGLVSMIVREEGYGLHAKKKRHVLRRHHRQLVTGLVVNAKVDLPRETRRHLRAVAHHIDAGRPATMTPAQLRGWQSLRQMVLDQRERTAGTRPGRGGDARS